MKPTQVDIRVYWDQIKPGLKEIRDSGNPGWRLEDIYVAVSTGVAELWLDLEEDPIESFMIWQEKNDDFMPYKNLLLWVAYCKQEKGADKYEDTILKVAKERGCKKIRRI